jgi:hypothetical protein
VLYSYRKLLPVPDGAVLASDHPIEMRGVPESNEGFVSRKALGKLLRGHGAEDAIYLKLFAESEEMIEKTEPHCQSWLSRFIMERIPLEKFRNSRTSIWEYVANRIKQDDDLCNLLRPLFNERGAGDVPLGFPIVVSRRDTLRSYLAQQGIFCPVHWPLFDCGTGFETEQLLSGNIMTIPTDQEMSVNDVERLFDSIQKFYGLV